MTSAEQVLDRARSQVGVAEDPAGSNRVLYADWYGLQGPWCAMFVSWCTYMEGLPLPATTDKGFAYTPAGARWFQQQGRWSTTPEKGSVVFFDFPGDGVDRISHVGFVEVVEDDGTVVTIEGNTDERGGRTGGQVLRRRRRSGIVGYGLPAYDEDTGDPEGDQDGGDGGEPPVPAYAGVILELGSFGGQVRILQARLVQIGVADLDVDGDFGPRTDAAVREFQRSRGLDDDGLVGELTWAELWRF